ncbi:hypothetical protein Pmani_026594 [Petrolisthes manimaculis]|uniref:Uncharacterized protein n=1 Tax=Petrolisthes manimaculis TaxID=1843537 RepID=A0AAE1P4W6_9EUCA|nr:hypothetical protein Pmani_026594 [Petrolisthes manimaculis]
MQKIDKQNSSWAETSTDLSSSRPFTQAVRLPSWHGMASWLVPAESSTGWITDSQAVTLIRPLALSQTEWLLVDVEPLSAHWLGQAGSAAHSLRHSRLTTVAQCYLDAVREWVSFFALPCICPCQLPGDFETYNWTENELVIHGHGVKPSRSL